MNYGPNDNEISTLYKGRVDPADVRFDTAEVERVDYYSLPELEALLANNGVMFSFWFEQILRWYLGNPSALEILEKQEKHSPKKI
jgi:isopentenyldiphosphate isomerase